MTQEIETPTLGSAEVEEAIKLSDAELARSARLVEQGRADHALAQKLAAEPGAEERAAAARALAGTPAGFAQLLMGVEKPLYPWQVNFLSLFENTLRMCKASLSTPNGAGKFQPRDEPVLTPTGWRPIGDLKVGDAVMSPDGTETVVTHVHPQGIQPVARVTFDDGSWTRCGWDHLWKVQSCFQRSDDKSSEAGLTEGRWLGHERWSVLPLHEVAKRKRLHRYIPIAEPAQFSEKTLPIDPYTLGVLLGDGCFQKAGVTVCTRPDTLSGCKWSEGVSLRLQDERGPVSSWRVNDSRRDGRESPFMQSVRSLGLEDKRSWEKFIPRDYFLGSVEQRLALLRGLMDTDGTMGKKKTQSPEYNTTSRVLADHVIELVQSLGGVATMTTRMPRFTHKGEHKLGRMDHRIRFMMPVCPFLVERKAERWATAETYGTRRIMDTITPDGEADCVCITVAHPSGLYVTRGHIVTHNSSVIVACLALWWISVHPQGKVVITTKDSKQLDNQIWPAIEAHKDRFPEWDFIERMVRNRLGGFIVGFTTDDPGRAEGWHKINDTTGPLLIIEDEAKSIADAIDMALDRCTYNAKLLTSSPGLTEGFFWRSHREDQPKPPLGYHHLKIGLKDCPHIPKERIDNIIAEYGEDHWFTRSTLYGEFTDSDSDTLFVIPKHIVKALMENPPPYVPGGRAGACDFAAGRAENVFAAKVGNKISVHAWKDPDPLRAVHEFIRLFIEYGLRPHQIRGDAGGMGIVILRYFAEQNWPIIGVNNEAEPVDTVKYPNIGAETWHDGAIKLGQRNTILPNDPVLFQQLTERRAAPTSKGILGLETKREMAARGVKSGDRADAVLMVLKAEDEIAGVIFDETGLAKLEATARAEKQPEFYTLSLEGDKVDYERRSDGWLKVLERPIVGRSYICVLNPCRHSEQLKNHALLVVRAGFTNASNEAMAPKLVARVILDPFKLDARPLAQMANKLARWYGRCMVVPVVHVPPSGGDRGDVVQALRAEGAHVYARQPNQERLHKSGRTSAWEDGWESDAFTQSLWINALADAIREDALEVDDMGMIMQLYTLNPKEPSATRDAEALGVALQLIGHASTYVAPKRSLKTGEAKTSQYS